MESLNSRETLATFLITLALISSSIEPTFAGTTATDFIRRSCSTTTYPTLCFSSLSSHANAIRRDPKLLATTALSVCLDATRAAAADMVRLAHSSGLSPREASAMHDCVEDLSDSVDQLRESVAGMRRIGAVMSDVQTWVSAALTNEDTCMDGFAGSRGAAKAAVQGRLVKVVHLTSNALALVNSYAAGAGAGIHV